jgi:WD40 repeat protein
LLSASNDGTARIWDLRTNKGVCLLKATEKGEVATAKAGLFKSAPFLAVTAINSKLNFFDLRKPSLVLKEFGNSCNLDEINDVDMISLDKGGIRVASCDDSGATVITDFSESLEPTFVKSLEDKHDSIVYKCKFSN